MTQPISRRSVAKGAMWSVPAVAVASAAPAMAVSGPATIGAAVCNLFYGTGTINNQYHTIFFQLSSNTGTIPAGSVITNQVCVDPSTDPAGGTTWNIPTSTYPANNDFAISFTDSNGNPVSSGTQMSGSQCFNVVFTFNNDVDPSKYGCLNGIVWNDVYQLRPASTITVTQNASVTGSTSAGTGSVKYKASRRYPNTVNNNGRLPHTFINKSGTITCFTSVSSSQQLQSDGADDVVCYPTGTNITTARCTWGTSTCAPSTTGLCTPPYKGAVSGQTNIPAMC